jgi:hypothetical protein
VERLIPILITVVGIAAWQFFLEKSPRGPEWRPLGMAFGMTAAAAIVVVAGAIGYTLNRHDQFVAGTAWAGHVIWSQILIGAVVTVVALYFWRKGLAELRRVEQRE